MGFIGIVSVLSALSASPQWKCSAPQALATDHVQTVRVCEQVQVQVQRKR